MTGVIRIIIERDVNDTNPNRLVRLTWQARAGRMARAKTAAEWAWALRGRPVLRCPVTVDVIIRRARKLDHDNAIAALKPYLDGLFKNAVVPDDSPDWLTLGDVTQETSKDWRCFESVEFIIRPREIPG